MMPSGTIENRTFVCYNETKRMFSFNNPMKRGEAMTNRIRYESLHAKTGMNRVKAPSMPFDWSINPYRGCQHGCSFCYARSTHAFLGMEADDTFQKHIVFKANVPEVLEAQLKKMSRSRDGLKRIGTVAIGTATDPYQPLEAKTLLTRKCLEILAKYRVPATITTRSPLILRDIDVLKELPLSSVNVSVNTLDREVWRHFEPASPFPLKRLETVQRLVEEGIPAGLFMAPILPYITDSEDHLSAIVAQAASHKAQFVMPSFLRLGTREVKSWFFRTLHEHYPSLVVPYAELYRETTSVPQSYKEPIRLKIRKLFERYGIRDKEPAAVSSGIAQRNDAAQRQEPEQLTFPF